MKLEIQLTLEQGGFELQVSTYAQIFFNQTLINTEFMVNPHILRADFPYLPSTKYAQVYVGVLESIPCMY